MSVINFLKLQWIKRKLMIISIVLLSVIHFNLSSSFRSFHFKAMSILTGDHYYTTFTLMLPPNDDMSNLLIEEIKNISSVASVTEINTEKVLKEIKKDTAKYGLDIPNLVTEVQSKLYQVKIDPFVENEVVESIRTKVLSYFPTDVALASPIKFAKIKTGEYNVMTIFLMEYGVYLIFLLLSFFIILGNALLFYKMLSDAMILQSINRSKAISLKNYLVFQGGILLLAIFTMFFISNVFSILTVLVWITLQSILAFIYYGIWGRNYQIQ